jgi:hypothetical protein
MSNSFKTFKIRPKTAGLCGALALGVGVESAHSKSHPRRNRAAPGMGAG